MNEPLGLCSPEFVLMIVYGFIFIPVYVTTFLIIHRKRRIFKSSFYRIYLALAPVNILIYFLRFFITRLPVYTCKECALGGFFESSSSSFVVSVLAFYYHSICTQCALIAIIAIDRFIILRQWKPELWRKVDMKFVLTAFVLPLSISICVFCGTASYVYVPYTDSYKIDSSSFGLIYAVFNLFALILIPPGVISNVIILRQFMKNDLHQLSSSQRNIELKLYVNSAVEMTLHVMNALLMGLQFLFHSYAHLDDLLRKTMIFSNDAMVLLPPVVLLFTSDQLRRETFKVFRTTKKKSVTPITPIEPIS